jgi:hypothetical protein
VADVPSELSITAPQESKKKKKHPTTNRESRRYLTGIWMHEFDTEWIICDLIPSSSCYVSILFSSLLKRDFVTSSTCSLSHNVTPSNTFPLSVPAFTLIDLHQLLLHLLRHDGFLLPAVEV